MNKKPNPTIPPYIQLAIELNNLSPQITAAQSAFATWSTQCDSNGSTGVETFQSWLSVFLGSAANFNTDPPNNPYFAQAYSTFVAPILDSLILWASMNYLCQNGPCSPCNNFLEWWNAGAGGYCTITGSSAGLDYYTQINQTLQINVSPPPAGSVTCTYQPFGNGSAAAEEIINFLQNNTSVFTYQNSTLSQWNQTFYSQACPTSSQSQGCSTSPSKHPLNTSAASPPCPPTTPLYQVLFMYSQGIAQQGYIGPAYLTSLNPISFKNQTVVTLDNKNYPNPNINYPTNDLCFSSLTYDPNNSILITSVSYNQNNVFNSDFLSFPTSPLGNFGIFSMTSGGAVTPPITNSSNGWIIAASPPSYVALLSNTTTSNWSLYFINNSPQIYETVSVGQNITPYPQYSTPPISMNFNYTLVYVCCCNTNQVLIYNVNNADLAATITTINGPTQAAFTLNNTPYVTGSNGVFTIDTNYTATVIPDSPDNCQNIVITPNGNYAYFNTTSGSLYVIDILTNNKITMIQEFNIETDYTIDHMIASPDSNFIYITANPPPASTTNLCPIIYALITIDNTYISISYCPSQATKQWPYPPMISGVAIVEGQDSSR